MYLSVPEGISINSFIDTLHYSTVDDVVALREDAIRPRSTSRLLSIYCPFLRRSGIYLDSTGGRDIVWMFAYILWPPLSLKHLYSALYWIMANNYGTDLIQYLDNFLTQKA